MHGKECASDQCNVSLPRYFLTGWLTSSCAQGWEDLVEVICFSVSLLGTSSTLVDTEKLFWVIFSSAIWSSLLAKLEIEQHLSKSDLSRHEKLASDEKCKYQNPVSFLH